MELDLGRVRSLVDPETAGSRVRLAELYDAYLSHARVSLVDLRDALAAGDASRVRAVAHAQKGASGMVGATRIAAAFAGIEQAPDDRDAIAGALDLIADALTRLVQDVNTLTGRSGTT